MLLGIRRKTKSKGPFFFFLVGRLSLSAWTLEICRRQSVRGKPVVGIHSETGAEWLH